MINVKVSHRDNNIIRINVTGHAEAGPYGHDLVCAGVSSVVFGALNALESYHSKQVAIKVLKNEINIEVIKNSAELNKMLNYLLIQLETIEDQYSNNIKIHNTEV